MTRNTFKKSQKRKEKNYFKKLKGVYKFTYSNTRKTNASIKKNKTSAKFKDIKASSNSTQLFVRVPDVFDIYSQSNSRQSIKACNKIVKGTKPLYINVRNVELISAAAGALLMSSIYKALGKRRNIKCNYPKDKKTEAILQKIGFYAALNNLERMTPNELEKYEDINCWFIYKDTSLDMEKLSLIVKDFTTCKLNLELLEKKPISKKNLDRIESSLIELIGNVAEHAYLPNYKGDKHWVFFVKYDNDTLSLIISDSGRTIPITFVQYHKNKPNIRELLNRPLSDNQIIKKAIIYGTSGTKKQGRGKGLSFVEESISQFGGHMIIYSRKGCYMSTRNGLNAHGFIKIHEKIRGTIINLNLKLSSLI